MIKLQYGQGRDAPCSAAVKIPRDQGIWKAIPKRGGVILFQSFSGEVTLRCAEIFFVLFPGWRERKSNVGNGCSTGFSMGANLARHSFLICWGQSNSSRGGAS
jgi:hypothetical protein